MGMSRHNSKWIMGCIKSTHFVVVINGLPSKFFSAYKGLRQAYALSPLLFLLLIDTLSRKLKDSWDTGHIKGVRVSNYLQVTHLMFVDDILFGGQISIAEWSIFHKRIKIFGDTSELLINETKSKLIHNGKDESVLEEIRQLFGISSNHIDDGFNYLGFILKLCGFKIKKWEWLIGKFKYKLDSWKHKWMSLGGRLIMLNPSIHSNTQHPSIHSNIIRALLVVILASITDQYLEKHLHFISLMISGPLPLGKGQFTAPVVVIYALHNFTIQVQ